ncbi:hypothetical protein GDO78_021917 [Eleutherodactylus coqui]|uniref:Uncharacterized protein n=1 Tax=Eleutherodactylus coqui TaxID=57060 RepID=A0A8J6EGK0_ELECQ|nr:hypothetical protein GDO78_021917 [Eleutherodactylus coqui]
MSILEYVLCLVEKKVYSLEEELRHLNVSYRPSLCNQGWRTDTLLVDAVGSTSLSTIILKSPHNINFPLRAFLTFLITLFKKEIWDLLGA